MNRKRRLPDNIGIMLDNNLDTSIRKKKHEIYLEILNDYYFKQLTETAHGATRNDNERLARAILEARWDHRSVGPVVEEYAKKFIYPYRTRNH